MAFTKEQIDELAIAQNRVQSGEPGVATDTNAGDQANLNYAATKIGQSNVDNIQDIAKIGTGSPLVPTTQPVSDGTDALWDERNAKTTGLSKNMEELEADQPPTASVIDQLSEIRGNIGQFTSQQEADIKAAGEAAAAQYNDQLEQAQYDRKTGLPQDVVRAGSRGGFENTQIAGTAAVRGTSDANGAFVGAGGMLDESRQAMDRNISVIVNAQKQAALQAEQAYKDYLRDGQESDYNAAMDLVKLSQDMENDKETIRINQERLEESTRQFDRTQTRLEQVAAIDAAKAPFEQAQLIMDTLDKIPAGQTFEIDGETYEGTMVPEAEKAFFSGSNIISLMGQLDDGETLKLPPDPVTGTVWTIEGTKDKPTTTAIDDNGNLSIIDKNTGEVISKVNNVGKTKTQASSGGGVAKDDKTEFKFSSDDTGRLLAVGFTSQDAKTIQSDINEYGVNEVIKGMSEEQAKAIRDIASGITPSQVRADIKAADEPESITEAKRKVIGGVNALMSDNASNSEIEQYIKLKGYTKADFSDLLKDYKPTTEEKSWWKFWE